jgi:hypothetical protein
MRTVSSQLRESDIPGRFTWDYHAAAIRDLRSHHLVRIHTPKVAAASKNYENQCGCLRSRTKSQKALETALATTWPVPPTVRKQSLNVRTCSYRIHPDVAHRRLCEMQGER